MNHEGGGFVKRGILLIILIFTVIGCATPYRAYKGEQLPKDQVAVIKTGIEHFYYFVLGWKEIHNAIVSVDGQPCCTKSWFSQPDVEVLPGHHNLTAVGYMEVCTSYKDFFDAFFDATYYGVDRCTKSGRFRRPVNFNAKAGHVYDLESEYEGKKVFVWIEDSETGEVVSGEKPPE